MKNLYIYGLALSICTIFAVSCDIYEFEPKNKTVKDGQEKVYTISASASDEQTRTTMDGFNINWASGDGLTIWHAAAGSNSYTKDNAFTTTGTGHSADFSGSLNGNALDPAGNYDWYILYPWKELLTSPEGDTSGWVGTHNVGIQYQTQSGIGDMSHLAGQENLLYCISKNVSGAEGTPSSISMKNLSAAVRVKVTNNSGESLRVHTVIMKGPDGETISGQHAINFTEDPPSLTANPTNSFNRIRLDVTGGDAIANGSVGEFYFTCKPLSLNPGDQIKIIINGYERTFTMAEATSIQGGKIKTINFDYDRAAEDYSGVYFIYGNGTGSNSGTTFLAEARDYEMRVLDGTGTKHLAFAYPTTVSEGTLTHHAEMMTHDADADADIDAYKFTFTKVGEGAYAGMYTIRNSSGKYLSTIQPDVNYITFQNTPDENSYWDVSRDEDNWQIVATKSSNRRFLMFNLLDADYPRITAFLATDDKNPTPIKMALVSSFSLNEIDNPAAYVRVKETLPDFTGDDYLLVYMSDPNTGLAFRTDASYNDNGSSYKSVTIKHGKIAFDSTLQNQCRLRISAHEPDASNEVFTSAQSGKYTLFRQDGFGFGIYVRTGISGPDEIQFNNNTKYGRFCYTITYDPALNEGGKNFAPGGMEFSMTNQSNAICFIRYNTDTNRFVIGAKSFFGTAQRFRNVQLFKLEN